MEIKRWRGYKKAYKLNKCRRQKCEKIMSVSLGILPIIEGKQAEILLDELKKPTYDKEILENYAKESKEFFDIEQ
ncbi:hypothetical protein [Clostridium botulinum]